MTLGGAGTRGGPGAGDGNLLQLQRGRGQREIDDQALAEREEDGVPPLGREPDRGDIDPVWPAHRQVLDEVSAARAGRGLPALAGGCVGDVDDGLLERCALSIEHATFDGRAGDALRCERWGGAQERRGHAEGRERGPLAGMARRWAGAKFGHVPPGAGSNSSNLQRRSGRRQRVETVIPP